MAAIIDRVKAAYQAFRFPAYPSATRSFGAQVFWPDWPSQTNVVSLAEPNLTESSLIMSAVNWAGTVFAEPTVQVLAPDAPDEWTPVEDHPLAILWERPNPYYSGATMLKAFAYYWFVNGNVYLLKRRNANGEVRELWLLHSDLVSPQWPVDGSEFISHYEVKTDGAPYRIEMEDIIHFRYGLDPDNHRLGLSPVRALVDEVLADESALNYSMTACRNFGVPPFIVSPKPNADAVYQIDDVARVKSELMAAIGGVNRGTPAVFGAPTDVTQLSFNPGQMALTETHSVPEERVCAVLGIPALVLGFGFEDHATYSNYQTALEAAWQSFVIPTLKLFATELTNRLLPEFGGYGNGQWVEFDTSEIWALQADEKDVATREVMKWNAGLITRNEARAAMGMDPYVGDAGDELAPSRMAGPAPEAELKQFGYAYDPTQKDADEIRRWWRENVPDEAATLLDAKIEN
jgi:HK97 family phage portal protein